MDPFFLAVTKLKRRKYDECIEICDKLLETNQFDQAVWFTKCRALTMKNWIDDLEIDEEGLADLLLDENTTATVPKPGTSMVSPFTQASGPSLSIRPVTRGGRPITGFARPGTQRPVTGSTNIEAALRVNTGKPGTANRPVTSAGRYLRLGTASMLAQGAQFIDVNRLDIKKYVQRPGLAKALCDYLIYCENNPRKALELCAEATKISDFKDWWWKSRLGKCYFQLGLFRDAEKQFKSSLKHQDMAITHVELAKVYLRMDQPNFAIAEYNRGLERSPQEVQLLLGLARVHDLINDSLTSSNVYRQILNVNACNVEAIASLAAYYFYTDQPEQSLRFYRRLLQLGVHNVEIWNNLGLAAYYAGQYDICLKCYEKALESNDSNADVWFNIGHLAIGMGDLTLAHQALMNAVSVDGNHAESFCNLGIIELKLNKVDQAKRNFQQAISLGEYLYEPHYNCALLCYRTGDFQEAYSLAKKSLELFPDHTDTKELLNTLQQHFDAL